MRKQYLKNKIILCVIFSIALLNSSSAQYYIKLCVKGAEKKKVVLTSYYGSTAYTIDSTSLDQQGNALFQNTKKILTPGIYSFVFSNKKSFNILINKEQNLTVSSDTSDFISNLKIEGSDELASFVEYVQYIERYKKEHVLLTNQIRNSSVDSSFFIHTKIKELETTTRLFSESMMTKYSKSILSVYISLMLEPRALEVKHDSVSMAKAFTEKYKYYTAHYFDAIDFSNEMYLRFPEFEDKITYFFNRLLPQNSDTIIYYFEKMIARCQPNQEMYRFVLRNLFQNFFDKYESKIYEPCFMYLVDNYYMAGKASWAKDQFVKMLTERINLMRPTLYGAKAPELKLLTPQGKTVVLSQLKSTYTVLFFYEYDCGLCKKEIPKLLDIYKQYKGTVEVVAVYMHSDKIQWEKYIEQNKMKWINANDPIKDNKIKETYFIQRVPCLFLLDKDKKIIEKKISTDRLKEILKLKIQ